MENRASILHIDLDAFFAAVEQRDKPSLRGRPVVVGGVGPRGVVATASYEARRYGVRSAMSTAEARSRCPHAAFLTGRFDAYRATSAMVMALLRRMSPLVEPLSLDEAYVDLAAGDSPELSEAGLRDIGTRLKEDVKAVTGGLTASVGIASSKLVAKIASELGKPDGLLVVPPGAEQDLLRPLHVGALPGVGPATLERLRRIGVTTVGDLEAVSREELLRVLGAAQGATVFGFARGQDDRRVEPERETKSISVEDTFDRDVVDPLLLAAVVERQARSVCQRLDRAKLSGRTVTVKIRRYDFTTSTRSASLPAPTDNPVVVTRTARRLLEHVDTSGGVRLLGVGVSALADWVQDDLFEEAAEPEAEEAPQLAPAPGPGWLPGMDVEHDQHGRGWVWGAGLGRVTVRFETAETERGPVRTFSVNDPQLRPASAVNPGEVPMG